MTTVKMIDIHTHILPGLDDGAACMEESLALLRTAERQGMRAVIATPHASEQYPAHPPQEIIRLTAQVQREAERMGSRCLIYPGEEIMYREDIFEQLRQGRLLTLAGSPYILVEFHAGTPYSQVRSAVRTAVQHGYRPVLAHAERYACLREEGRTGEIVREGAYLQMNYESLLGAWYDSDTAWCRRTIRRGQIHFLATDMHNIKDRRPRAAEALLWLGKRADPGYVRRLLYGNALKVLNGRRIPLEKE